MPDSTRPGFARAIPLSLIALLALPLAAPAQTSYTNTAGMTMVAVDAGTFLMGSDEGDLDEAPVHLVMIGQSFFMSAHEVTNAQYEQFDPQHRALRGKLGFSTGDDEAVVFVDWHQAVAFTEWLSEKENRTYRLPTEAEWEYAARAGTRTPYFTGDRLPASMLKNARESWYPDPERAVPGDVVSLRVGQTPPNAWGLYDLHGNVEEWTLDWYGPYEADGQKDPVGRSDGDFKVTRGGSHSTTPEYLRSANRMGTLPEDASWLIGFRVVQADAPATTPLPAPPVTALHQRDVSQERRAVRQPASRTPYFAEPRRYVVLDPTEKGPFFYHNHQDAITEMPNGDLLAIWYTTKSEAGRYLAQAASRLRYGADAWEPASIFWDAPDRNDHGNALWWDGDRTIYHVSGLSAAATWGNLAMLVRTSTDNGASWSKARIVHPEHGLRNQVIASMGRLRDGRIFVTADAVTGGNGGTSFHVSADGGQTWTDAGGTIAGIHASAVGLEDGRVLAFGRGDAIDGRMPKSISSDGGATWRSTASAFDPLSSTQRLVLLRLAEGPLFLASFADNMTFTDDRGGTYTGSGIFGALSYDEGETWPVRKLITAANAPAWRETARSRPFVMSAHTAEPRGYMAGTQAMDGTIHLISTVYHYAFNQAWLETPAAPSAVPPLAPRGDLAASFSPNEGVWRYAGLGAMPGDAARRDGAGLLLEVPASGEARWAMDLREPTPVGSTVEMTVQVQAAGARRRGVEWVYRPVSHPGMQYHLAITPDGVYSDDSYALEPLALGLDNGSAPHTYRIGVAASGLVHVYRDGQELGRYSLAPIDEDEGPTTPGLQWGGGAGVRARIDAIRFDPRGPFAPAP
ncbi:MAG: SUMF1/EgtB/PvdO family nonheme iron enzyme [Rhodothermales bacterium]